MFLVYASHVVWFYKSKGNDICTHSKYLDNFTLAVLLEQDDGIISIQNREGITTLPPPLTSG